MKQGATMKELGFSILLLASTASGASAQWMTETTENAFDDTTTEFALAPNRDGYGLGFRCSKTMPLELVFMAPDKTEGVDKLNLAEPILKVRIDKQNIVEIPTEIETSGELIKFTSAAPDGMIEGIGNAKKRVAVAAEVLGQRFHETEFGVIGAKKALSKIQGACAARTD